MVIVCSCLIVADRVLAKILFAKEFYLAWQYAPFLMISVVFGSLSGLLGGIFAAGKRSGVFAKTTIVGASVNTILNILLVNIMGVIGAAVATLISYILVWLSRYREARKLIKLDVDVRRDCCSYLALIIQAIAFLIIRQNVILYVVEGVILFVVIAIYLHDIKYMATTFLDKINNR